MDIESGRDRFRMQGSSNVSSLVRMTNNYIFSAVLNSFIAMEVRTPIFSYYGSRIRDIEFLGEFSIVHSIHLLNL